MLKAYRVGFDKEIPEWLEELIDSGKVLMNVANGNYSVLTSHYGVQLAFKGDYIRVFANGSIVVDRYFSSWLSNQRNEENMVVHSKIKAGD